MSTGAPAPGRPARSIYITSPEGETGKSTVALGVAELMIRQVQRVGVFRPVTRVARGATGPDERDYVLELLLAHEGVNTPLDQAVGVTYDEIHADPDAALTQIVTRYHEVEKANDVVIIIGTDYTDVGSPTEFSYNARIAANLGAPVLLVVSGRGRTPEDVRSLVDTCVAEIAAQHAGLIGVIANRADADDLEAVQAALQGPLPAWVIPNDPFLTAPTVEQLITPVDGTFSFGDREALGREVLSTIVAAMNIEHLVDRLEEGAVVVTPGDRADILLGLLIAHTATSFPSLAAIVLSGGFETPDVVLRLMADQAPTLPIISSPLDTFDTARRIADVRGRVTTDSQRKKDTALALFERRVDGDALIASLDVPRPEVVTPLMFEYTLLSRAREDRKHIVLPEGDDDRILRAASTLLQREVAALTLLGDEALLRARAGELGLDIADAVIVDPRVSELREQFAIEYARLRAHKGITLDRAREIVGDVSYFGTMMVHTGLADGMVSGAAHTTAHTIRPSFEIIKTPPGVSVVSSVFLMCMADRVLVYGDCAVNPDPTAEQLADIAISSAATAEQFGVEPRIAMLSYSTGESGTGEDVDKVRRATALVKERRPELFVEGPIQYDAAVDASVAATKMPGSAVAGRATVFIFPDLNTGNNTYKAVQRSAGAIAVGPVLQGLNKPVNDLSRGALVQDIVNTVAITAVQAQGGAAVVTNAAPDVIR